jgi:pantetheine-phosphate adenylyltransferase
MYYMKRKAIYAGSFDPVTNGHLWTIEKGSRLFDELVVAVGVNSSKRGMFSIEERVDLIRDATREFSNVEVGSYEEKFLAHYARDIGAEFLLRGIRGHNDVENERTMMEVNMDLAPEVQEVFLMSPQKFSKVSSSLVRGLVGYDGWENAVKMYVPMNVYEKMAMVYNGG